VLIKEVSCAKRHRLIAPACSACSIIQASPGTFDLLRDIEGYFGASSPCCIQREFDELLFDAIV
jgi:hypothetical protein